MIDQAGKDACADYIDTLATFFVHGATGPGERAYTVEEIGDMIREWTASLRTADWRGSYLAPSLNKGAQGETTP